MSLNSQARSSLDEAVNSARANANAARQIFAERSDTATQSLADLSAQLKDVGSALLANAKSLGDKVGAKTEANPLLAVGVAFAAGVLLTRLFARKVVIVEKPASEDSAN